MFETSHDAALHRRNMCKQIANELWQRGYDVDWRRVNRNYIVMRRWYSRQLALGYLVRQTGIKRRKKG